MTSALHAAATKTCRRGHTFTGRMCRDCERYRQSLYRRGEKLGQDGKGVVPADRLRDAIQPMLNLHGVRVVAELTGVQERQLWRIRTCESRLVSWTIADKLLLGLDLNYLWTWPPEQGGFADIYAMPEDEAA